MECNDFINNKLYFITSRYNLSFQIYFQSICNAFHSILAEPKSTEESKFLISHSENEGILDNKLHDYKLLQVPVIDYETG